MATTEITQDNLNQLIDENPIVLLDFWAGWCAPCRGFAPLFEQASEAHPDVLFGKIDTETQQEMAAGFGITSIPTLMAFREGIVVFAQPGALRAPQLEQVIKAVRDLDMDEVRAKIEAESGERATR